jgi:hypothetical protein
MGQIIRANSAEITYENGMVLYVRRMDKRYDWRLLQHHEEGMSSLHAHGETEEVQGVSAGIHQAMVAAAAIFSQVDQAVLEDGSDGE